MGGPNSNRKTDMATSTPAFDVSSPGVGSGDAGPRARVTIEYSRLGNYAPVAERLAAAIREEFPGEPVETDLVPAVGGVYEVRVNGKLVFSKKATYRLPEPDEIFYHVRAAVSPRGLVGAASGSPSN